MMAHGFEDNIEHLIFENTKGLRVSNDSPWAKYIPFAFPLRGYYRDYGQARDFENTENVKVIEDFFGGIPIDKIMEMAEDGRWIEYLEDDSDDIVGFSENELLEGKPNIDILKELTFTDIRESVYDKLVDMFEDEVNRYWFGWQFETPEEYIDYFGRVDRYKERIRKEHGEEISEIQKTVNNSKDKVSDDEFMELMDAIDFLQNREVDETRSFVPRHTWFNFLKKLRYDSSFSEDYKEFCKFHFIISRMNLWIENSNYGTQERNHELYIDLYSDLVETLKEEQKEYDKI